jgi:hypothetical protein
MIGYRLLLAIALVVASSGCKHVEAPADEGDDDVDSDSSSDSSSETEPDTYTPPTDTTEGFCQSEPVTCDDVGPTPTHQYMGCCYDGALYWCWEQDQIWVDSIDCEQNGGTCGYDSQSQWMDCIYD